MGSVVPSPPEQSTSKELMRQMEPMMHMALLASPVSLSMCQQPSDENTGSKDAAATTEASGSSSGESAIQLL